MENDEAWKTDPWNILVAKIIAGSGLFVASVICGVIPFKLAKVFKWTEPLDQHGEKKTNLTVNILLCFGGGVLLATTFLHLLPEINTTVDWLVKEGLMPHLDVSLGELLMMVGFFLIYLIEELVHNYLHRHQNKKKKLALSEKNKSGEDKTVDINDAFIRGVEVRNSAIMNRSSQQFERQSDMIPADHLNAIAVGEKDHSNHGHAHGHSHLPIPTGEEEDMLVTSLRGLLIVLALSIHELFEGFAVGLEKDATGVYFMFAAVSAHKFVIAFCIGGETTTFMSYVTTNITLQFLFKLS